MQKLYGYSKIQRERERLWKDVADDWTLSWHWVSSVHEIKWLWLQQALEDRQAQGCSSGFITSVKGTIVYDEEKEQASFVLLSETQGNDLSSQWKKANIPLSVALKKYKN